MDQEAQNPGSKNRIRVAKREYHRSEKNSDYSRLGIFDAGGAFAPLKHKTST
jgi:hypothetical protein